MVTRDCSCRSEDKRVLDVVSDPKREEDLFIPDEQVAERISQILWWLKGKKIHQLSETGFEDNFLIFAIFFSYLLNAEEISIEATPRVLFGILKDYYRWDVNKDIRKIWINYKLLWLHFSQYLKTRDWRCWVVYLDWWDLKDQLCSIANWLVWVNWFRDHDVAHWENRWWRLREPSSTQHPYHKKFLNSRFIFPPPEYLNALFERMYSSYLDHEKAPIRQASLLYTYTLLSHFFKDGNSRCSRLLSTSYLDSLWFSRFRLFTFLTEIEPSLMSYEDTLKRYLYSRMQEVISEIKVKRTHPSPDDGEVIDYMSVDNYEAIILEFSDRIYEIFLEVFIFIEENIENIVSFFNMIEKIYEIDFSMEPWKDYVRDQLIKKILKMLFNWKISFSNSLESYLSELFRFSKRHTKHIKSNLKSKYNYSDWDFQWILLEIKRLIL